MAEVNCLIEDVLTIRNTTMKSTREPKERIPGSAVAKLKSKEDTVMTNKNKLKDSRRF